jgi:quinol monooxygenase YgiN
LAGLRRVPTPAPVWRHCRFTVWGLLLGKFREKRHARCKLIEFSYLCTLFTWESQMRRRTFLAVSAAMLASGADGYAHAQGTSELNAVVTQQIRAGKEEQAETVLRDLQAATLAHDKGCLRFEWYRASTPRTFILLERWADQAAAQAHLNAPHVVGAVEKLLPLIAEQPQAVRLTRL